MEYCLKEVLSLVLVNNIDVVKSKRQLHKINIALLLMIIVLIIFILGVQYFYKDPMFEIIDTETIQQESSDLTTKRIYILHVFVRGYLEEQDIKEYGDYILTLWSDGEYASENPDYIRVYLYDKPEGTQNNVCIAEINLLKP